jgi:hypothetical protein
MNTEQTPPPTENSANGHDPKKKKIFFEQLDEEHRALMDPFLPAGAVRLFLLILKLSWNDQCGGKFDGRAGNLCIATRLLAKLCGGANQNSFYDRHEKKTGNLRRGWIPLLVERGYIWISKRIIPDVTKVKFLNVFHVNFLVPPPPPRVLRWDGIPGRNGNGNGKHDGAQNGGDAENQASPFSDDAKAENAEDAENGANSKNVVAATAESASDWPAFPRRGDAEKRAGATRKSVLPPPKNTPQEGGGDAEKQATATRKSRPEQHAFPRRSDAEKQATPTRKSVLIRETIEEQTFVKTIEPEKEGGGTASKSTSGETDVPKSPPPAFGEEKEKVKPTPFAAKFKEPVFEDLDNGLFPSKRIAFAKSAVALCEDRIKAISNDPLAKLPDGFGKLTDEALARIKQYRFRINAVNAFAAGVK